jgi:hypothetical protein
MVSRSRLAALRGLSNRQWIANDNATTAHFTGLSSNLTSPTISPLLRGVS